MVEDGTTRENRSSQVWLGILQEDIMLRECFNHLDEEGGLELCFYELRCGLLKIWL